MSTDVSDRPRVELVSAPVLWAMWFVTRVIALIMVAQVPSGPSDIGYLHEAVTGSGAKEYPALLLLIPWLFVRFGATSLDAFTAAFVGTVLLLDALVMAYLAHYPGQGKTLVRRDSHRGWGAGFWIVFGMLAGPSLYMRLDMLPAFFAAACLVLVAKHDAVASVLLAIAAAMKLWPGVLAAGLAGRSKDARTAVRFAWFGGTLAVIWLITVVVRGLNGLTSPMAYQANRGLQIESVIATPFMLRAAFNENVYAIGYAESMSYEIAGPGTGAAVVVSSALTALVVAFAVAWALSRLWGRDWTPTDAGFFFVAVTLLLMVTNKVFSPQYMVWVAPILAVQLALLWQPSISKEDELRAARLRRVAGLVLVATGLTTLIYPFNYGGLLDETSPDLATVIVLMVRNLLVIGAAGAATWNLFNPVKVRRHAAPAAVTVKKGMLRGVNWKAATLIAFAGSTLRLIILAAMAGLQGTSFYSALISWDAQHYLDVVEGGYFDPEGGDEYYMKMAFFPGFPYLVRAIHMVTQLPPVFIAVMINFVFLVLLAAAVMALCERMKLSRFETYLATVVVTCAPLSIVFNMPYTEAMFMALALWAIIAMIDERWILAGALIFLVSVVRLTAFDLIVAFAIVVAIKARTNWKAWACVVVSAVPLVAYLAWSSNALRDHGGYFGVQEKHWNSHFDFGAATIRFIVDAFARENEIAFLFAALSMIVVPVFLIYSWGKLPLPAWLFAAAVTANVLLSAGIMNSRPRLLLPTVIILIPLVASLARKLGARQTVLLTIAWVAFGSWFSAFMLTTFEYAI